MSTGLEKTFTNERTLPFPPAQLFNVVADVGKYQEFVPYCVSVPSAWILAPPMHAPPHRPLCSFLPFSTGSLTW